MESAVSTAAGPLIFGIPLAFLLFGAVLAGVVILHKRTLEVAFVGLALILAVRLGFSEFDLAVHLKHEWAKLANLFGLLVGFALLADHFEASHLPELLPRVLPRGARGCFTLLLLVWLLSGVLDNIAAAIIGATVAASVFERRVHLGYLAAIVAAANAGGAGSVLGDTTTTMMWIDGVSPLAVLPAYLGSATALVAFGIVASLQQAKHAPIQAQAPGNVHVDGRRLGIVVAVTAGEKGSQFHRYHRYHVHRLHRIGGTHACPQLPRSSAASRASSLRSSPSATLDPACGPCEGANRVGPWSPVRPVELVPKSTGGDSRRRDIGRGGVHEYRRQRHVGIAG